jgi:hypothetical protein
MLLCCNVFVGTLGGTLVRMTSVDELLRVAADTRIDACAGDIIGVTNVIDALNAKLTVAVGGFEASGDYGIDGSLSIRDWLTTHTTLGRAGKRIASIGRKLRALPVTQAAWLSGELNGAQVAVIDANVNHDHVAMFADHETDTIPTLVKLTERDTSTAMRHWRVLAESIADRAPREAAGLHLNDIGDQTRLDAEFTSDDGAIIGDALKLANRPPDTDDLRTAAQRRAGDLVDICRFFIANHTNESLPRNRTSTAVIVDVGTLMTDWVTGQTVDGRQLCTRIMNEWLCDTDIIRVVTAGRSRLLDIGRKTRIVPAPMALLLAIRDKGCRYPGCHRPGSWCQAHHVQHWRHGGATNLANLVLLCGRHHHMIHQTGWHLELDATAVLTVKAPNGKLLISHPPP